jgi:trigger factor
MTYEALPEVPEVDLSAITLERLVVKADDAAVDEALDNLAESARLRGPRKKGPRPRTATRS